MISVPWKNDLCTLEADRNKEIEFLKDTFIANDCPVETVDNAFSKYVPDKYNSDIQRCKKDDKPPLNLEIVIKVPFIQDLSNRLKKELEKEQVKLVFGKGNTLETQLCKLKPKNNMNMHKEIICKKGCLGCTKQVRH